MKQIFIIHGGDSFLRYDDYLTDLRHKKLDYERLKPKKQWRDYLVEHLPDYQILLPAMPNRDNAKFEEWKIMFEKLLPFFDGDTVLIGHSLGAMFLSKYLQSKPLKQSVAKIILLAGGYDDQTQVYGEFSLISATNVHKSTREIYLLHSRDDFVVPFRELSRYVSDLPAATVVTFDDKNHFLDYEFPELVDIIKK